MSRKSGYRFSDQGHAQLKNACSHRVSRRYVLQGVAAGAVVAAAPPLFASPNRIERLIAEARSCVTISERMDVISKAMLGAHYKGDTLIGGPKQKEQFVVRDDGFDCVTYCETVLAAACTRDFSEFEANLRRIRYRDGVVDWYARNHYFYEWRLNNIDNAVCRPVMMDDPVTITKTLNSPPELGKRRVVFGAIARGTLLANKSLLLPGDIIGFVSVRAGLDYFHTGLVAFGRKGELLLRHASKSRHHVLDEPIEEFFASTRVRWMTIARPRDLGAAHA